MQRGQRIRYIPQKIYMLFQISKFQHIEALQQSAADSSRPAGKNIAEHHCRIRNGIRPKNNPTQI
ncbi:MAG: hypothetical protein NC427_16845 [Ruminococcus flavefaciens]|nr:hypothetical protein [Ruminococcus flavefaciens]